MFMLADPRTAERGRGGGGYKQRGDPDKGRMRRDESAERHGLEATQTMSPGTVNDERCQVRSGGQSQEDNAGHEKPRRAGTYAKCACCNSTDKCCRATDQ